MHSKNTMIIKLFYVKITVILTSVKRQRISSFFIQRFLFTFSKDTLDIKIFVMYIYYIYFSCLKSLTIKRFQSLFDKGFSLCFFIKGLLVLNKGIFWFL